MVSTPMSWAGVAVLLVAIALAIVVSPVIAFAGIIGLGLIWAAPNQAGTVNSYTYHGSGQGDFRGTGANDRRRGL
jgi:hypothetical protein